MEQRTLKATTLKATTGYDQAGMTASLACAVHCAVVPVALAALPALGLAWLDSPWVDWCMVVLAMAIALRAHRGGYHLHRRCLPAAVAFVGVLTIVVTICLLKGSTSHHYIQASGAVIIAGSHLLNHQFCKTCPTCRSETECAPPPAGHATKEE